MSENKSLSNASPKGGSRQKMLLKLIKSVLFLGSVLIGSMLLWSDVVWPLFRTIEARDWNELSCVVISSQLNTQSGLTTTYAVDIVYSYEILGETYQSNRYSFTDVSRFNEATAIVDRYPPGARTSCYVNPSYDRIGLPRYPTDAVIEQCDFNVALKRVLGLRPLVSFLFILFGVVGGLSIWSSFLARFIVVLFGLVVLAFLVYFTLVYVASFFEFSAGALSFIINVVLVFILMASVDGYRTVVKKCTPWKPLAASKHLAFVPGKFFGHEPYIRGTYRHHHLKLETFSKNRGKFNYAYTRLLVSGDALAQGSPQNEPHLPDEQVVRKDAIGLLPPTSRHYILKEVQLKGSITARTVDQHVYVDYEQEGIENDLEYLGYLFDLFSDLAEVISTITATHRHHRLKLEIVGTYAPCTRLSVSVDKLANGSLQNDPHLSGEQVARKDAMSLLTPTSPNYILKGAQLKGSITAQTVDQTVYVCHEQSGIENNLKYLRYLFDLLSDLAEACSPVVALGGEAVPFLKDMIARHHHESIAAELLKAIARDTKARIGDRALQVLCPTCLTRYKARKVWLEFRYLTYYGCRICGQSRELLEGRLVAVLDSRMDTERVQQDGTWRVNWLARRALFDFDEVEIVQATDEDVERFVVQVGNDTDEFRRSRYKEISCKIAPDCRLSENTLRILKSTFDEELRSTAQK